MSTGQRISTGRLLVALASVLWFAAGTVLCFGVLVFGPLTMSRREPTGSMVLAAAVFLVLTVLAVVGANLVALRAGTSRRVLAGGCGTLLGGAVLGVIALLLLI